MQELKTKGSIINPEDAPLRYFQFEDWFRTESDDLAAYMLDLLEEVVNGG